MKCLELNPIAVRQVSWQLPLLLDGALAVGLWTSSIPLDSIPLARKP